MKTNQYLDSEGAIMFWKKKADDELARNVIELADSVHETTETVTQALKLLDSKLEKIEPDLAVAFENISKTLRNHKEAIDSLQKDIPAILQVHSKSLRELTKIVQMLTKDRGYGFNSNDTPDDLN